MAEATISGGKPQDIQLLKALHWYDGFVIALCNPGFLIGSLGYSIGALGGWGAMVLWTISVLIAGAANRFYAEMASMFPDKPGGIALYAYEAWRKYFSMSARSRPSGIGSRGRRCSPLRHRRRFADRHGVVPERDLQLPLWAHRPQPGEDIAAVVIIGVWVVNIFGIKPAVWVAYVVGVMLMVPLAVFIIGPFVTGKWHADFSRGASGEPASASPPPWSGSTSWAGPPTAPRRAPRSHPSIGTPARRRARCAAPPSSRSPSSRCCRWASAACPAYRRLRPSTLSPSTCPPSTRSSAAAPAWRSSSSAPASSCR